MNKNKSGLKKTEKSQEPSSYELQNSNDNNQNQNSNQIGSESTEYPSNTSGTTCSSVTTSPNNHAQTNVNETINQANFNSNDQSSLFNQNQSLGQTPIPLINYYSYIQGSNPYQAPIDYNAANWSQTIAMAKNGISDPIMAAYMNAAGFTPEITSYDQFNFAYPQAFSYGYGNTQMSPMNEFQVNQTRNFNKRQSVTNSSFNTFQPQSYYNNTANTNNQKNRNYNNYSNNKLENDFNSLSLNDNKNGKNFKTSFKNNMNQKSKFTKNKYNFNSGNFVNNQNFISNENQEYTSYGEMVDTGMSKSDSKTWANIVGHNQTTNNQMPNTNYFNNNNNNNNNQLNEQFNEQIVQSEFSSYMLPNNSSSSSYRNVYDTRKFNNYNNSNFNSKNVYNSVKQFGQNNNQQNAEFNLDNNAFPPINSNGEPTMSNENSLKNSLSNVTNENQIQQNNNFNYKNSYKRQQYNNYQKQQLKQFGTNVSNFISNTPNEFGSYQLTNFSRNNNFATSNKKQENDEDYYSYKRHQPSQLNISSFMTNLDKKFFVENSNDENKSDNYQVQIDLTPCKIDTNSYNPIEFNISPNSARFFVIKSYSEDDVYVSIKYNVWCSTEHGNRRLNSAYVKDEGNTPVYLFFSVNGSRHFCGMAQMTSRVDYNRKTELWSQDKWRGCFQVKWIYVKDVPNSLLRNIKLENNDNKPVTNSRDTQEIPFDKGIQVLKVFHTFQHSSSIFDDFDHYEHEKTTKSTVKADIKLENQLIIPAKDDSSSSSICSPDSSTSYTSNLNPNENYTQQTNQFEINQSGYNQSNLVPVTSTAI